MKYNLPRLKNGNLCLRCGNYNDFCKVYEFDFGKLMGVWEDVKFEKCLKTKELWQYVKNSENSYAWLVYVDNNPVGFVFADRENKYIKNSITLYYCLHPSFWGKGIMKDAVKLACGFLLKKYKFVVACFCTGNDKSKRLLDKMEFEYYKTVKNAYERNGKTVDEFVYLRKE